ncbi:nucleolar protein 14 homolog [Galleria mellonella]|uniref:Nucleolar protein 14 homolog n=1 Tax=Galleria mellonella TaxID=7137 RepID=A0A6J1WQF6_GALME|nr:nucleolar protein 14 homolog [Galleria mellonella]
MAKAKNKRNSKLADTVHAKRREKEINKKKLNPFEVHINREKIKVLGKKSKHDKGLPGVSRAKAIKKRKETLGTEMRLMNKTNTFIDRRIGEKNNHLSAEDRMVARFAAERARQHSKKSIYNLADDEILTHRGQTLEQIEKFDDPRSSDDENEDGGKFGGLDDDFVSEGHFGGGILSKTDLKDGAKSHKDLIEQLIAESKKRKAEKQKEKEQTLDLTEKLDNEWKDLQPVVFKKARVENESIIDKLLSQAEKKNQDYDKMMRELKFEKRGTPSDGLKTDEKQAKEEKEKMEQWERERQQRMLGDFELSAPAIQKSAGKHRSADDLDDNFELEDEKEFMLAYDKDGKPLVPEKILKDYSVPNAKPKFDDGISDTSSEDNDDDEDDNEEEEEDDSDDDEDDVKTEDESDNKSKTNGEENFTKDEMKRGKIGMNKNGLLHIKNSEDGDSDDNSNDEVESDDKESSQIETQKKKDQKLLQRESNSKGSSVDEESADQQEASKNFANNIKGKIVPKNRFEESSDGEDSDVEDNEQSEKEMIDDFKDLKESDEESEDEVMMKDVDEKISSFFDLKLAEGDNLKELLSEKTPSQQASALQKLIKSYDPSLAENNKELLSRLFAHLLQYINDLFIGLKNEGEIIKSFLIFDKLAPFFYDLSKTNKVSTKKFLVELIKEKHDNFKKRHRLVPDLDTLIFFKLVSLLYPTSDFRHPVTTPSLIFMSEILTNCRFNDAYSISRGLYITALILEYTVLSKRLVPSAINFLRGVLYLCANTSILYPVQVIPPFRFHKDVKILNLEHDCSTMEVESKMAAKDLVLKSIDNNFKIKCLLVSSTMLKEFFDNFNDLEAQQCIFEPHIRLLGRIDFELYPKKVVCIVTKIMQYMKESLEVKTYTPMTTEKHKPKALRLYEPDIQEIFTGSKSSKLSREEAERRRLKTKYKKEMKGALREIRRDKAYIASVKIKQKIQSDNIRREKVKQIYKEASIQQGELNKLKRTK